MRNQRMRPLSLRERRGAAAPTKHSPPRRIRQLAKTFAETDDFIRAITERLVKRAHVVLRGQHLQVQLRAAERGQRRFDVRDQTRADAMPPQRPRRRRASRASRDGRRSRPLPCRPRVHPSTPTKNNSGCVASLFAIDRRGLRCGFVAIPVLGKRRVATTRSRRRCRVHRNGGSKARRSYSSCVARFDYSESRIERSIAIIWSISSFVTFSAGMKRSRFGRAAFSSRPSGCMSRASSTIWVPMSLPSSSARSRPSPRSPLKPRSSDNSSSLRAQIVAARAHAFEETRRGQLRDHRIADGRHQWVAVVGAALIARLRSIATSAFAKQRSQRHAAADALAERHDVRLDARQLIARTACRRDRSRFALRRRSAAGCACRVSSRSCCMNSRVAGITPPSP